MGTPAFAAESSQGATRGVGTPTSATWQPSNNYLQPIWSDSNQFGSAQDWIAHAQSGDDTSHFSFTNVNGEILAATITPRLATLTTSAGSIAIEKLPNGEIVEHVFITPGACASEPNNLYAVTGVTASFKLYANGALVDSSERGQFAAAREAFVCRTASVTNGLRTFASTVALPNVNPGSSKPGRMHTDISSSCAWSAAKFATAAAALAAAMAGEVPSGGLDSPAVLLAWAAYVEASLDYERDCANAI